MPSTSQSYTATFNSTPVPTGLVGAWGLNEGAGTTATDSSGSGNNGVLSGAGVTWDPAGKFGRALAFNGSSGNVTIPHTSSLSFSSSYTLEAWVKPSALSGYETDPDQGADRRLCLLAADGRHQDQQRLRQRGLS